jgi:uncharacterized repeat protein (TIGR04138 family)
MPASGPLATGGRRDTVGVMPPDGPTKTLKPLEEIVDAVGLYPAEAYVFVQQGLNRTVQHIHGTDPEETADTGKRKRRRRPGASGEDASRHITGRDLCLGLRDEAWARWGLLARTVLARWNVTTTLDFGRIVFALVEYQHLQKTDDDTIDDFRGVFDFRTGLEADYRVTPRVDAADPKPTRAGKKS